MNTTNTLTCCVAPTDDPQNRCGIPAAALVVAGCLHEHIIRNYACLFHLSTGITSMRCRECWLSADPHHCSVHLHEVIR
jgi:hypothetical protein